MERFAIFGLAAMVFAAVFTSGGPPAPVLPAPPKKPNWTPPPGYVIVDSKAKRRAAAPVSDMPQSMGNEVVLTRQADGHFYADAMVNGMAVRFLVDTGATSVALSRADAERIGLTSTDEQFYGSARSAGGEIAVRPVMLDRVNVGGFERSDVPGAIVKEGLDVSLLGQTYLSKIGKVTIEGDRMTLR